MCFFLAKTDEVLKAKVAKREEEIRRKEEEGKLHVACVWPYMTSDQPKPEMLSVLNKGKKREEHKSR